MADGFWFTSDNGFDVWVDAEQDADGLWHALDANGNRLDGTDQPAKPATTKPATTKPATPPKKPATPTPPTSSTPPAKAPALGATSSQALPVGALVVAAGLALGFWLWSRSR